MLLKGKHSGNRRLEGKADAEAGPGGLPVDHQKIVMKRVVSMAFDPVFSRVGELVRQQRVYRTQVRAPVQP